MRQLIRGLLIVTLMVALPGLTGCGGSHEDEVLDYDPEVSKQKSAEYEEQMKEAMKNQGGPPKGKGK